MQRYGKDFLKELLTPLIKQWGRDAVLRAIEELGESSGKEGAREQPRTLRASTKAKPSAFALAQRATVSPDKKPLLLDLAIQFEHRAFLPSIGDARAFLEMRGLDARGLKQRPEAFRRVIKAIADMPKDSLQQLVSNNERAGGPSQLGPLSDAIKLASASVRSSNERPPKRGGEQQISKANVEESESGSHTDTRETADENRQSAGNGGASQEGSQED